MFQITLISSLLALLIIEKPTNQPTENKVITTPDSELLNDEGLILLQRHCYTCHNPKSASHDEILAPPLWGMKKQYLEAFLKKDEFKKAMISFVQSPSQEKALMKGPIKRFGLMPKPVILDKDLEKIVDYIYSYELENPAWHIEKGNDQKDNSSRQK